jgi:hypothetical protein
VVKIVLPAVHIEGVKGPKKDPRRFDLAAFEGMAIENVDRFFL